MESMPSTHRLEEHRLEEHRLEELSDRAMPGRDRHHLGEWICRAADGATSRANSCCPMGDPGRSVALAIDAAEQWFDERGLGTIFQIWDGADPEVGATLDRRSYRRIEGADVLVLSLGTATLPLASPRIECAEELDALLTITAGSPGLAELDLSGLPKIVASAFDGSTLMSSGVAVIDGAALGLFAMATEPDYRRRGLAADTLASLLHAGADRGAAYAWLQVMPSNEPARRLYHSFGFRRAHGYHYRVAAASKS